MKWVCIALLKAYKATLSKIKGKVCIFTPSCSVYSMEVFYHHGFFKGAQLTAARLLKCSPLSKKGGIDLPPLNKKGDLKWSF